MFLKPLRNGRLFCVIITNNYYNPVMKRRNFMHLGMAGSLGLPYILKQEACAAAKFYPTREGVAKSIIHVYLPGGMAHQESWDPKPYSPLEYRGPFSAIKTKIDGIQFSEVMKNMANVADKISVIRSMTHGEAAHERGTHNMFNGHKPSPAIQYPSYGSVISHELGGQNNLPPYVCVPNQPNEYAGSGYLSSKHGPFSLGSDPANNDFEVKDLKLPGEISADRFEKRKSLLSTIEDQFNSFEKSDALSAMDSFYQSAYQMISSPQARGAFDLNQENEKMKDKYGRNQAGMRMLLARRLVEAGVRLVTLTFGSWDHHQNIQNAFETQGSYLDQALAALITDLSDRGLLDSTLVMVNSEFGRTPKINKDSGRDHWPRVFSSVLAGGGIKEGFAYGSSDAFATEVEEDPVSPMDYATTVYNQIGITADKELMAPGDRPMEIVDGGKVLDKLIK